MSATPAQFAQRNLAVIRKALAAKGVPMPAFDDQTAALAVAFFAKLGDDEPMLATAKRAIAALATEGAQ